MIQITPHMRILVAVEPVDFRKGIDGLAAVCRQVLASDPLSGTLFVFCSRRGHALKCLIYDGQGFWICQKRLSSGRFTGWPKAGTPGPLRLDAHQLHLLLWNGDPARATTAPLWRPLKVADEMQPQDSHRKG
jgi:transposase